MHLNSYVYSLLEERKNELVGREGLWIWVKVVGYRSAIWYVSFHVRIRAFYVRTFRIRSDQPNTGIEEGTQKSQNDRENIPSEATSNPENLLNPAQPSTSEQQEGEEEMRASDASNNPEKPLLTSTQPSSSEPRQEGEEEKKASDAVSTTGMESRTHESPDDRAKKPSDASSNPEKPLLTSTQPSTSERQQEGEEEKKASDAVSTHPATGMESRTHESPDDRAKKPSDASSNPEDPLLNLAQPSTSERQEGEEEKKASGDVNDEKHSPQSQRNEQDPGGGDEQDTKL